MATLSKLWMQSNLGAFIQGCSSQSLGSLELLISNATSFVSFVAVWSRWVDWFQWPVMPKFSQHHSLLFVSGLIQRNLWQSSPMKAPNDRWSCVWLLHHHHQRHTYCHPPWHHCTITGRKPPAASPQCSRQAAKPLTPGKLAWAWGSCRPVTRFMGETHTVC
jgi:hypothetical protein